MMKRDTKIHMQSSQQGVVLLEALIAVLIFSIGILAISGLQGTMIKNTSDAKYRADAAFIAQQRLGAMWANPTDLSVFALGVEDISNIEPRLPNGTRTVTVPVAGGGEVRVEINWTPPGQQQHTYTTFARITGAD